MSKTPCCYASNSLSRDRDQYMRCSTKDTPQCDDKNDKSGDKKKKSGDVCCSTAFQMRKQQDLELDESVDTLCAPKKGAKAKNTRNKKEFHRCVTANMICMKLNMPGRELDDPNKFTIKGSICKGCNLTMCPDRINVNCLPEDPSCRFTMLAECLEKELEEGIALSVMYKKREIGRGCYVLPDAVIQRITESLQEVVHTANVELTCKGCTVGMCTVRLAMQVQCQVLNSEDTDDSNDCNDGNDGEDACGQKFGCSFSPSDFSSSSDPCLGFTSVDNQYDDNERCAASNDSSELQNVQATCQKLIDMAGPYNIYNKNSNDGCIDVGNRPPPADQFSFGKRPVLGDATTNRMCPPMEAPPLKQMGIKRQRECPMCHEDVYWLPKIAACPHCGYKPVPYFEEKSYNEHATAHEILTDFNEHRGDDTISYSSGECPPPGTSEAIDTIVNDYKSLKQSIKRNKRLQQQSSCPTSNKAAKSGDQQPPDMVAIFTELKKLFDGGEDAAKSDKIREICNEACKLAKMKHHGKQSSVKCDETTTRKRKKTKKHKIQVKSRVYAPMDTLEHRRQGHVDCFENEHKVPAHMGWLWTHSPLAQKRGWRPGSIRRSIRELMGYFLKDFPVDSIPLSKYMSYHKNKPKPAGEPKEKLEDLEQVPTLHIEKKNDEYLITLRPLKDPESLKRAANPYANMKPVQFRIVKNPLLKKVRDMKRCLKNMGYSKCTCHRPVMQCYCRSFIDKKRLIDDVKRECEKQQMASCEAHIVLSDTTDSEAEFDFGVTPPAGLMKPERLVTKNITNTGTQYNENDWAMPTMYPHPPNATIQYGGCVIGERQGKFPWIYGKGYVHAEPKPPKMRNPPKKKPKRKFPGAPLPREEGGCDAVQSQRWRERGEQFSHANEQLHGERLQRLNRAAYPPTAAQFREARLETARKVQSNGNSGQRFTS